MAHFITLFFLSIGLNFGTPQTQTISEAQNSKQLNSVSHENISPQNNSVLNKRKMYTHNSNLVLIEKGGSDGWDGTRICSTCP